MEEEQSLYHFVFIESRALGGIFSLAGCYGGDGEMTKGGERRRNSRREMTGIRGSIHCTVGLRKYLHA